jgi:hypothetical protein
MRKLQRSVLHHFAEKSPNKTILYFRYLWKQSRKNQGDVYAGEVKVKPRKSMLHRAVEAVTSKRERGMSR